MDLLEVDFDENDARIKEIERLKQELCDQKIAFESLKEVNKANLSNYIEEMEKNKSLSAEVAKYKTDAPSIDDNDVDMEEGTNKQLIKAVTQLTSALQPVWYRPPMNYEPYPFAYNHYGAATKIEPSCYHSSLKRHLDGGIAIDDTSAKIPKMEIAALLRGGNCTVCRKGFNTIAELNTHINRECLKPFGCQVCGKTLSSKQNLKRHQAMHTAALERHEHQEQE